MAKHRRPSPDELQVDDLPDRPRPAGTAAAELPDLAHAVGPTPDLPLSVGPPAEDVAVTAATYWSVDHCRWPAVGPGLPDDVVDLLAPPVVVGVARVAVTSRATPPGARPGRALPPAGAAPARRPAPGPAGRHRRARDQVEHG